MSNPGITKIPASPAGIFIISVSLSLYLCVSASLRTKKKRLCVLNQILLISTYPCITA